MLTNKSGLRPDLSIKSTPNAVIGICTREINLHHLKGKEITNAESTAETGLREASEKNLNDNHRYSPDTTREAYQKSKFRE